MKRFLAMLVLMGSAVAQSPSVGRAGCTENISGDLICAPIGGKLKLFDGIDASKRVQFDLSAISPGATRNATVPNGDFTFVVPFACTNQFVTAANSSGEFICSTVQYSQISGTPTLPQNTSSTAHQWFNSFNAVTGAFGKSQPDYSDLTGTPTLPANTSATAHQFFTSYSSAAGTFTKAQPDYSDLTGTPVLAHTITAVAHKWLNSYDCPSGIFTQTQPDYSDLTGTPALPANTSATAHQFFTAYNSATGAFSKAQPSYADISGTPALEYQTVQDEGAALTQRASINFSGAGVSCADDAGNAATKCTVPGGGGSPTEVQVNGVDTTAQTPINFQNGANITASNVGAGNIEFDLTGTIPAALLPNPSATTLGGIESLAASGSHWINSISTSGVPSSTQPAFSDLSGSATCAQLPAITGDITTSAGSCAANITAGAVQRSDLAADAVGWQFLGCTSVGASTGCTNIASGSTINVTPTIARRHYYIRFVIAGYSGTGVARAEFGNTTTVDTGTNYAFGGLNIASGTSTAPTVSGVGSGSTAQEGVPVSGSPTTAGRFVQLQISNAGARIKYFTIETSGVGASAAVTPNFAHIAGTWNNTTNGVGIIQFKACSATTGSCSTVNFLTGTTLTVWGRDDN